MQVARSIYGLALRTNVTLAGLAGLETCERTDILLQLGGLPSELAETARETYYQSDDRDENGRPSVAASRLRGRYIELAYSDGTRVVLDEDATQIWATTPPGSTVEDTATYLLGPVLGFALRLRGVTCLHASCVAIGGLAFAFVGAAGAGKSTLAAAFARRSHAVLTDDVAPLDERGECFVVRPAYPRIRLWPDSVEFLFGSPEALPRITPTWEKRFLSLAGPQYRFGRDPLPLGGIYLIGERVDGAPRIETIPPRAALMHLVRETYTTRLIGRELRASEFDVLGRLVTRIPIRRLCVSTDAFRIDDAVDLVVRNAEKA